MYSVLDTSSQQMFSVVGSAYISERHSDERHSYFPAPEGSYFNIDFDELLAGLRSALSLR